MKFEHPDGATPIDPNEAQGLRPTHLTTQNQLNRLEFENIRDAQTWLAGRKLSIDKLLSSEFMRDLHKHMLGDVWEWAGTYRTTDKNIGIPWEQVSVSMQNLCDDTRTWIEGNVFEIDLLAVRFHHRLVSIHPFPDGNGRHARIMTDLLLERVLGTSSFSWGNTDLVNHDEVRARYINAMRAADNGDLQPLLEFVRS